MFENALFSMHTEFFFVKISAMESFKVGKCFGVWVANRCHYVCLVVGKKAKLEVITLTFSQEVRANSFVIVSWRILNTLEKCHYFAKLIDFSLYNWSLKEISFPILTDLITIIEDRQRLIIHFYYIIAFFCAIKNLYTEYLC